MAVVLILADFLADSDVHPCRLLAVVAALLSLAIVVAEATISPYLPNLSIFSRALHHTSGNELATELLTFVSLVGTSALCMMYPYSLSASPSQICATSCMHQQQDDPPGCIDSMTMLVHESV